MTSFGVWYECVLFNTEFVAFALDFRGFCLLKLGTIKIKIMQKYLL